MNFSRADAIRAMTDEQLRDFLMKAHDGELYIPFCTNKQECCEALDSGTIPDEACRQCMMEWLQKPSERAAEGNWGRWLFSSINEPAFRICDKCGSTYKVTENESPYNFCPNCGKPMCGGDGNA